MPPPSLVDSHCHLDFPDFENEIGAVIARARAAGVTRMVTICTRLRDEARVRAIAEAHDGVFYAAGTHPMKAADEPLAAVDDLVALAGNPRFVGIGETGLDYHYTAESAAVQQQSLRVHIEAARRTGLPLIVHARDADVDIARILAEEHGAGSFSCVMHCFTSGRALAETALSTRLLSVDLGNRDLPERRGPARDLRRCPHRADPRGDRQLRISRRNRIAASATNRPSSPTRRASPPGSGTWSRTTSRP